MAKLIFISPYLKGGTNSISLSKVSSRSSPHSCVRSTRMI